MSRLISWLRRSLQTSSSTPATRCRATMLRLEQLEDRLTPSSAGALDLTWAADGKITTDFGSTSNQAESVAVDSNGKMIVVGYSSNGSDYDFAVARYNADGSLDTSFSGDGKLTTAIGSGNDYAQSVVIDGSGRIVVAGHSWNGSDVDFAVVRYNTDGSLDASFSGDGKLTTGVGSLDDYAQAVAIDGQGKIIVAGFCWGSDVDFAVARFNTDGTLDASFDGDGKVTTTFGPGYDYANAVAIDGQGKIVVAGYSDIAGNNDFTLVRYNADGSLDTSFDGDGKVTTAIGSSYDYANAVAIDGQGKIVVVGFSDIGGNNDFAVVRYHADGSLDTTFDGDGKVTTDFGSGGDSAQSVAIDRAGKIIVAGGCTNANSDFAVAQYNTDGSLDASFDGDGKVSTAIGASYDSAYGVALDGRGRIVLAGYTYNGSDWDFALVRYNADGSLDHMADGAGMVSTAIGSSNSFANDLAIDGNGKIVVAGDAWNGSYYDFAVIRYNADGTLDTSFDGDGKVTTDIGSDNDYANGVVIDATGRIIVAGYTWNGSSYDFAVVRYNTDGSLDTTFDGDGKVTTTFGFGDDYAKGVAIDAYGRIVVAGYVSNGADFDVGVVRYNTDGSLDTAGFSGDGKVMTAIGSGNDFASGVAMDGNGKIVVAGSSYNGPYLDMAVVRYNADGSLDSNFSGDGMLTTAIGSSDDRARSIALDSNGKIVIAGSSWNGSSYDFAVVRYKADGALDSSFDADGMATTSFGSLSGAEANAVTIDGAGKIVAAGYSNSYTIAVARYNVDGSLDTTFDGDGKVSLNLGSGNDVATGVAIDGNGMIVVAGYSTTVGPTSFAVARFRGDNLTPIAVSTTYSVTAGLSVSITDPSYFYDLNGDVVTTTLLYAPAHGTITLNAYGQFTYTPDAGYQGSDMFAYSMEDSYGGVKYSSVSFNVVLPAVSATISDGNLVIQGTAGNDVISIASTVDPLLDVFVNGQLLGSFAPDDITGRIIVRGFAGNDKITVASAITLSVDLYGGIGNDTLSGGGGNDRLFGEAGADSIVGNGGDDTLTGGADNDILAGSSGTDTLSETADASCTLTTTTLTGVGTDTLSGIERAVLTVPLSSLTGRTLNAAGFTGPVTLTGGGGNDTLTGGSGSDSLDGRNGSNLVIASGGVNFTLSNAQMTGKGTDSLVNIQRAKITITGTASRSINASAFTGSTTLVGGGGSDTLTGGSGDDTLSGGAGNDQLAGGGGTNTVVESAAVNFSLSNTQLAGLGTDTLTSITQAQLTVRSTTTTNRSINASTFTGAVTLMGGSGNDMLTGGSGNDSLNGGTGNDKLIGNGGDDTITGGAGNDTLNGGGGTNTLVESGNVNMTLKDTQLTGVGTDTLTSIQSARLTGGNSANLLNATTFTGAVTLSGGGGNDTLLGGLATNVLLGGAGNDSLTGGSGRDLLIGGSGADVLDGGGADDILVADTTTYVNEATNAVNLAALDAVMSEWTLGSTYLARIAHLLGTLGNGLNGMSFLNAATVFSSLSLDTLTGGLDFDWFLAPASDNVTDGGIVETWTTI